MESIIDTQILNNYINSTTNTISSQIVEQRNLNMCIIINDEQDSNMQ